MKDSTKNNIIKKMAKKLTKKKAKLNYFDEFIKVTEWIKDSTDILEDLMENYSVDSLKEATKKIHAFENQADDTMHEIRKYVISDFLPPIGRDSIGELTHRLDDIEDEIDEIAKNFLILNIEEIDKKVFKEYVKLLDEASEQLTEMFTNFKNLKDMPIILRDILKLYKLEERADKYYEKVMSDLFRNEKDPVKIIKMRIIYNCFESLFDEYEELADCVEAVVVTNS